MSRVTLKAAIDDYILKADQDYEDVLEALGYIEPEETVKEISRLEERVARGLKRETRFLLDEIAPCATPLEALRALTKMKAADTVDVDIAEVLRAEYKKFIPKMSWHYSTDMESPVVTKTISAQTGRLMDNWGKSLGTYVKDGTYSQLERLIREHVDEGKSVDKLTQAILDGGISEERYKARRIAQTETLRMHSYAKNEAMMQNPAVTQKMWRHTGAYRNEPRPNHQAMNGQTVPKDKPFTLYGADGGIYYPMMPRDTCLPPGESINCHCIVQEVVGDNLPRQALEYVPPHEDTGTGAFDYPISQYDRYRIAMGPGNVPAREDFMRMQKEKTPEWAELKKTYREVSWLKRCQDNGITEKIHRVPSEGKPNSVFNKLDENGIIETRRYFGKNGKPKLDFDVTDHGWPQKHKIVPHSHDWAANRNGKIEHFDGRVPSSAELIANEDITK